MRTVHSCVPEDLQDISESFHPEDGEANAASTSQESLAASPAPLAAADESNVQGSKISGSNFHFPSHFLVIECRFDSGYGKKTSIKYLF